MHKMGQVCARHPCHSSSRNPRMHCRQNLLHNRTHSLRRRKNDTRGKRVVGDITRDRKEGQQVHKMGQACAPHPCHNPSRNPRMHCRENLLHNRTHGLRRRKNDTGGKRVVGGITQEREKGRSASAQDGTGLCTTPMPQPLTQPSHALPKNAFCTTVLTSCGEGTITREGSVLWET